MKQHSPVIVWFRQDLRLNDNPALVAAAKTQFPIIFLYILDDTNTPWQPGAASRWWLHESLKALDASLGQQYHAQLTLKKGNPLDLIQTVIKKTSVGSIYWNQRFEPNHIKQDDALKQTLIEQGIQVFTFNSSLLHSPWEYQTKAKQNFKVFSPFWRSLQKSSMRLPLNSPKKINVYHEPLSLTLKQLCLLPDVPWYESFAQYWKPGEKQGLVNLKTFLHHKVSNYAELRNRPDLAYTSSLSPYLHFGEISPIQIWHACQIKIQQTPVLQNEIERFLSEIGWREFSYHLLYYYPELPRLPFRQAFQHFPWKKQKSTLKKWQCGLTGYPIVDAGMRQLWQTGWMHNRIRMVVASFLTKHLLQNWQDGQAWFWDTLVDADLANNAASWQWVAGCGADAAPYFRIFNPLLQGKKFDPLGNYVKKWVPELAALASKYIHAPWEAPQNILKKANIVLGKTYPFPIINHELARQRALQAYKELNKG